MEILKIKFRRKKNHLLDPEKEIKVFVCDLKKCDEFYYEFCD